MGRFGRLTNCRFKYRIYTEEREREREKERQRHREGEVEREMAT